MPIYQYKCSNPSCAWCFDLKRGVLQATNPTACPKCGSPTVKLPPTGVSIRIK